MRKKMAAYSSQGQQVIESNHPMNFAQPEAVASIIRQMVKV
jgi:hypothetical protein